AGGGGTTSPPRREWVGAGPAPPPPGSGIPPGGGGCRQAPFCIRGGNPPKYQGRGARRGGAAMPIRFRCPFCNQLLGIARRKAGTAVQCPTCRGRVTGPATGLEEPAP